jgi:hypothetical protein
MLAEINDACRCRPTGSTSVGALPASAPCSTFVKFRSSFDLVTIGRGIARDALFDLGRLR